MVKCRDIVSKFYRDNVGLHITRNNNLDAELQNNVFIVNRNNGLGDTLSAISVPEVALSQNKLIGVSSSSHHFPVLLKNSGLGHEKIGEINNAVFHSKRDTFDPTVIDACALVDYVNCGGGHFIQQIQRSLGLKADLKPTARLLGQVGIKPKLVVLSFGAGAVTAQQRERIHPRAREFYPEHKETMQKFINNNPQYSFVEIGTSFSGLNGVLNETGKDLQVAIDYLRIADFHLGIHSGITNLAAGIGTKSIVMINFPHAYQVRLPHLIRSDIPDINWLYPQNVHLHMDKTDDEISPFPWLEDILPILYRFRFLQILYL
jgi:hypothetical protein